MINKSLFLAAAIIFSSLQLFAQEQDAPYIRPATYIGHELIIGHGYMPLSQYNMRDSKEVNALGAISVGYRYHFSRLFSIGVVGSFEHSSTKSFPYTPPPNITSRRAVQSCYTMATELTFNYLTVANGTLRFYGVLGAGYSVYSHNYTYKDNGVSSVYKNSRSIDGTLQVVPIGIRFGNALGGFLEFGAGYRGLVNYGLTYRF